MRRWGAILFVLSVLFFIGIGLLLLGVEPHHSAGPLASGTCSFGESQVTALAQTPPEGEIS